MPMWNSWLPVALTSGSAPASKGVILEMLAHSRRSDALQAVTLIENVAMLSTLSLFGYIFSALSDIRKTHLSFYCNVVNWIKTLIFPYLTMYRLWRSLPYQCFHRPGFAAKENSDGGATSRE